MLRTVAAVVLDGVSPFELGVVCEVFGVDRSESGVPPLDFAVVAGEAGPLRTSVGGFTLTPDAGLERLATADLVAVPAAGGVGRDPGAGGRPLPPGVAEALVAAVDRGARVLSVCTGAFVLAAAGLLDGRRCTTHWMFADELARAVPSATVEPDVLYVEDGPVLTSAGTAAGIDACLHVVRSEFGARAAGVVARRMVVPPHREGGQAQFVEAPFPACPSDGLGPLLAWLLERLDEEHTVESLAQRAVMSPRTFARRFRAETGTTPYSWLLTQRVLAAQRMLEGTDLPVEEVARRCGFGSAAVMRHHFVRLRRTSPQAYRRTFRPAAVGSDAGPAESAADPEPALSGAVT
ncbi:MAG: helix-turn-helix domain-containing protein [Candidatus Nanopelagicales bacterium]